MTFSRTIRLTLPAIAGLALAALGAGAGLAFTGASSTATQAPYSPIRCAVFSSYENSMTSLQAVVQSDVAVTGTYRLVIAATSGAGRNNINQGGPFSIGANQSITLGSVNYGPGGRADIVFDLEIGGNSYACTRIDA